MTTYILIYDKFMVEPKLTTANIVFNNPRNLMINLNLIGFQFVSEQSSDNFVFKQSDFLKSYFKLHISFTGKHKRIFILV